MLIGFSSRNTWVQGAILLLSVIWNMVWTLEYPMHSWNTEIGLLNIPRTEHRDVEIHVSWDDGEN